MLLSLSMPDFRLFLFFQRVNDWTILKLLFQKGRVLFDSHLLST